MEDKGHEEQPLLRSFGVESGMHDFVKQSLARLRDEAPTDELRRAADDVLSGRRSLYRLFGDEEFTESIRTQMSQGLDMVSEQMSDEERAQLSGELGDAGKRPDL